jgi:hypothetical protein
VGVRHLRATSQVSRAMCTPQFLEKLSAFILGAPNTQDVCEFLRDTLNDLRSGKSFEQTDDEDAPGVSPPATPAREYTFSDDEEESPIVSTGKTLRKVLSYREKEGKAKALRASQGASSGPPGQSNKVLFEDQRKSSVNPPKRKKAKVSSTTKFPAGPVVDKDKRCKIPSNSQYMRDVRTMEGEGKDDANDPSHSEGDDEEGSESEDREETLEEERAGEKRRRGGKGVKKAKGKAGGLTTKQKEAASALAAKNKRIKRQQSMPKQRGLDETNMLERSLESIEHYDSMFWKNAKPIWVPVDKLARAPDELCQREFDPSHVRTLVDFFNTSFQSHLFNVVVTLQFECDRKVVTKDMILAYNGPMHVIAGCHSFMAAQQLNRSMSGMAKNSYEYVPVRVLLNATIPEVFAVACRHNLATRNSKATDPADMVQFFRKVQQEPGKYGCAVVSGVTKSTSGGQDTQNWRLTASALWLSGNPNARTVRSYLFMLYIYSTYYLYVFIFLAEE